MQVLAASPVSLAPAAARRPAAAAAARPAAALPRPQRRRVARAAARRMVVAAADGAQQLQAFATTEPQRVAGADGKLAEVRGQCMAVWEDWMLLSVEWACAHVREGEVHALPPSVLECQRWEHAAACRWPRVTRARSTAALPL